MSNNIGNLPSGNPLGTPTPTTTPVPSDPIVDPFISTINLSKNAGLIDGYLNATVSRPDLSIINYQQNIQDASQAWKLQLLDNLQAYISSTLKSKANVIIELIAANDAAQTALQLSRTAAATADDGNKTVSDQNDQIDNYNGNNNSKINSDKSVTNALNSATTTLNTASTALRADGTHPTQAHLSAYYSAQQTYQNALTNYNSYKNARNLEIQNYNSATNAYNGQVDDANAQIDSVNSQLQDQSSSLPSLNDEQNASTSGTLPNGTTLTYTVTFNSTTNTYTANTPSSPPANIQTLPSPPTTAIANIPIVASSDTLKTISSFFQNITDLINAALLQLVNVLQQNSTFTTPVALTNALSTELRKLLVPDAYIQSITQLSGTVGGSDPRSVSSTSQVPKANVGNSHIAALSSAALQAITFNIAQTQLTSDTLESFSLLSSASIGQTAIQAVKQAFGQIADELPLLAPDSPALPLAFAISFANLTAEKVANGTLLEPFSLLIKQNPQFANLSDDQKAQLALQASSLYGTIELLNSTNVLGQASGINNLLPQVLSQLPEGTLSPTFNPNATPTTSTTNDTIKTLSQGFQSKGFGTQESQTLAANTTDALKNGVVTNPATIPITASSVDQSRLNASAVNALLLNNHDLPTANKLANQVQGLLSNGKSYPSETAFRDQASKTLNQNGLSSSESAQVAIQLAVGAANANNSTTLPATQKQAQQQEISPILNNLVKGNLSAQLSSSLIATLYGTPTSDGTPPIGLLNRIHDILVQARNADDKLALKHQEDLINDFLPVKLAVSPAALLVEVRNLANLFTHSIYQSAMYAGSIELSKTEQAQQGSRV